jgi:hypothetical protein
VSFFKELGSYFLADSDIIKERIDICKGCKYLTKRTRCTQCGCFMKIKTTLIDARCPIGKW